MNSIDTVVKTARSKGAIGANAIVPKKVRELASMEDSILDFGSGANAIHTKQLHEEGYKVVAHDFSLPRGSGHDFSFPWEYHSARIDAKYDIVFASNVLNVQPDMKFLKDTLKQIKKCTRLDGVFIWNYPVTPRKMPLSVDEMVEVVRKKFMYTEMIGGNKRAPIMASYKRMG